MKITPANDPSEHEADQVAEQVMDNSNNDVVIQRTTHAIQRKCACGGPAAFAGECEECTKKKLQRHVGNRPTPPSNDDPLSSASGVPAIVHEVLRSPGRPLDAATSAFMEPRFGHDFSHVHAQASQQPMASELRIGPTGDRYEQEAERTADTVGRDFAPRGSTAIETGRRRDFSHVRVHTDARAAQSASAIDALAYTIGKDVVFGAGQYAPGTTEGRRLLAHELTHVVQQEEASAASRTLRRKSDEGLSTEFLQETWTDVNELGIVYKEGTEKEGGGVTLRKAPGGDPIGWLPQNTKVFILKEKKGTTNAYAVSVITSKGSAGEFGYVASTHVWRNLPDPDADVLRIKPGESPITIAFKHYQDKGFDEWGKDPRYVVNALVWVNQQAQHNAKGESGISKEAVDDKWYTAKSTAGVYIWLPGVDFMNAIYQKVADQGGGTGSITADFWQTIKKAGHWIAYGIAFVGGLLHGFIKSLWDAVAGLVTMAKDVLVSLFTGNVLSDVNELWEALKKIEWKDIKEAVSAFAEEWAKKLNSSSPWVAGHAYGYLTGYIMAEAAQLLLTGGTLAALKGALWASRLGKLIKGTRAFQALAKGIEKAGEAGGKVKQAIGLAADAVIKSKPFTVLADARRWIGKALLLSAETLSDLTLSAINKLRTLSDDAIEALRKLSEPFKRVILGCTSPCKVDLDVIKHYIATLSGKASASAKKLSTIDDILAALPAKMEKSLIRKKLKAHPALVKAIDEAGLTADDLAVVEKFLTGADETNAATAYRTFTRTLTSLVPVKIGPDVKKLNAIAEALIVMEPRFGAAFKGPMFESFAKLHLGRFRNLKFERATWDKARYKSLAKTRTSDGFIDSAGGLWDFKHTVAKVPTDQADDYFKILTRGMESAEGQKTKSVNFLFATKEGAEANADLVKKGFDVFYVTPPDIVTKLK